MRWLYVAGGVAALAVGAWYFGQTKSAATNSPTTTTSALIVAAAPSETTAKKPKDIEPLKMVEVIDLTRGYEPAPEETPTLHGLVPSALISLPETGKRMPAASGERWESISVAPREVLIEKLTIAPRDVTPKIIEINDDPLGLLAPMGKR